MPALKTWRCMVDLIDENQIPMRVILIIQAATPGQVQAKIYFIFGSCPNVEPFIVNITELKGAEQGLLFTI